MRLSYPLAYAGALGTTYSMGQEFSKTNNTDLTSTETQIMGYLADMASEFDFKAQEKKYIQYQSTITGIANMLNPENEMPEAPTFSDMTNLALSTIGFETEVGFSRQGVECTACRWGSWAFRETIGSRIS